MVFKVQTEGEKSRAPGSRGREGAKSSPFGVGRPARSRLPGRASCGSCLRRSPGLVAQAGFRRAKDKKVLSPIGRKGRFVAEKCNSLGGNGRVLGKFSVLHNQQKEMQEFIRQFDRGFGAKKDRPGGVLRRFCFRIKAGQRAGSLVGETLPLPSKSGSGTCSCSARDWFRWAMFWRSQNSSEEAEGFRLTLADFICQCQGSACCRPRWCWKHRPCRQPRC